MSITCKQVRQGLKAKTRNDISIAALSVCGEFLTIELPKKLTIDTHPRDLTLLVQGGREYINQCETHHQTCGDPDCQRDYKTYYEFQQHRTSLEPSRTALVQAALANGNTLHPTYSQLGRELSVWKRTARWLQTAES